MNPNQTTCPACGHNPAEPVQTYCRTCRAAYQRARRRLSRDRAAKVKQSKSARRELKQRCIEYLGGKCNRCHIKGHPAIYDFHHPGKRSFVISNSAQRAWDSIQQELDQCELLCKNCHAIHHYDDGSKAGRPPKPIDPLTQAFMDKIANIDCRSSEFRQARAKGTQDTPPRP